MYKFIRPLLVLSVVLTSLSGLAIPAGREFTVEVANNRESIELCRGCTHAVVFYNSNLDEDDGPIVNEALVKFYKGRRLLYKAVYQYDVEAHDRYINSHIRDLVPFIREVGNEVERFSIRTSGTDEFSLVRF